MNAIGAILIIAIGAACTSRTEARDTPLPPRDGSPSGYFTYQNVLTRFLTDRGTFIEPPLEYDQQRHPTGLRRQVMQTGQATVSYRSTMVKLNGCTLLVDVEQRDVDERVQSAERRVQGSHRTSYSIPLRTIDPASIRISGLTGAAGRWVSFTAINGENAFEATYGTRSGTRTESIARIDLRVQDEESAVHLGHAFADAARECGSDGS